MIKSTDKNTKNKEFELFAAAANFIKPEFEKGSTLWKGSPFEWVLTLPSASKGKFGKRLVYLWCGSKGFVNIPFLVPVGSRQIQALCVAN